ncbi:EamA family transporter [Prosthecomicrobium sp. N25]|uniref:EamA family transporter n=1 Tax=Prosthecomicrobium sp. N25 TaxID=3129254 RepID=UPI003077015C
MTLTTLMIAVMSVSLNAFAQIALRKTMLNAPALGANLAGAIDYAIGLLLGGWLVAGLALYAVSIGLWLVVLKSTEVSLAYPLLSIGYIIAAAVGYLYLNENVGIERMAGIALICLGIVVISRSS